MSLRFRVMAGCWLQHLVKIMEAEGSSWHVAVPRFGQVHVGWWILARPVRCCQRQENWSANEWRQNSRIVRLQLGQVKGR